MRTLYFYVQTLQELDKDSKISKAKGVEMCVELLSAGKTRKEILQTIAESCNASERTVDNWIKEAAPIVAELHAEAERIRARENEAAIVESAKKLNLTRERILEEYAKIAFFDIRTIFTVDGGLKPVHELPDEAAGAIAGIESFEEKTTVKEDGEAVDTIVQGTNRKIKITEKTKALDSLCKVLGYNAPDKQQVDLTSNGQTIHNTFVIKRRSDRGNPGD